MVELKLSSWLKADDFGSMSEMDVVFLDEGHYGEFKDPKTGAVSETFEVLVGFGGQDAPEKKSWTMNYTSQRTVSDVLGLDTKLWVGKLFRLELVKQNVHGTMKSVIYAKAPKQPVAAPLS